MAGLGGGAGVDLLEGLRSLRFSMSASGIVVEPPANLNLTLIRSEQVHWGGRA